MLSRAKKWQHCNQKPQNNIAIYFKFRYIDPSLIHAACVDRGIAYRYYITSTLIDDLLLFIVYLAELVQ